MVKDPSHPALVRAQAAPSATVSRALALATILALIGGCAS